MAGRFEQNPRKVIFAYFRGRRSVIFYYLILLTVPALVIFTGFGIMWGVMAGIRMFGSALVAQNFTLALLLDWAEIGAAFLAVTGFGTLLFFALWRSETTVKGLSARYWENRETRLVATLEAFAHLAPFYNGTYLAAVTGFALLAILLVYLGFGKSFIFVLVSLLVTPLFIFSHITRYYFLSRVVSGKEPPPAPSAAPQPALSSAEPPLTIHVLAALLKSRLSRFVVGFMIFPLLIAAALLLPIISGVQELMTFEANRIGGQVRTLQGTAGIQLTFPADSAGRPFWVKSEAIERATFLEGEAGSGLLKAAEAIPPYLLLKSPFFRFHFQGAKPQQIHLTIPISPDAGSHRTLDLYTWDGQQWQWLPSQTNETGNVMETTLSPPPRSIAIMETQPLPAKISSNYRLSEPLPDQAKNNLAELHPQNFQLGSNGSINAPEAPSPEFFIGTVNLIPSLSNRDAEDVIRIDLVEAILQDRRLRERHIQNIVDLLEQGGYQGIDLDYEGLDSAWQEAYVDFLTEVRQALPADKQLFVHVDFPRQLADNSWETGGYDWVAIGELADVVRVPLAPHPNAYTEGRQMQSLLDWAVGRVNRYKLQPTLRTNSSEFIGDKSQPITLPEALSHLGTVSLVDALETVKPRQTISLTLSGLQAGVNLHADKTGIYTLSYQDDNDQEHILYLENAATISAKMQFLAQYNLRGVHLQNLLERETDSRLWRVVQEYPGLVVPPLDSHYQVMWQAEHETGVVINQDFLDLSEPVYTWPAPRVGGIYTISATLRTEQITNEFFSLGSLPLDVESPPPPTPQASPTPAFPTPTVGPPPSPTPPATPPTPAASPPPVPVQPTVEDTCRPRGEFADLWAANEEAFGCPIESEPLYGTFVEMSFERGHLYWMQDIDRYGDVGLAIATVGGRNPGDSGTWSLQQEHWNGEGICPVGPPPEGLFLPDRNLAQVWCDMNGLEVLGYATIPQQIVANQGEAALQNFDKVILLQDKQGHEQRQVYILSRADNAYRRVTY